MLYASRLQIESDSVGHPRGVVANQDREIEKGK